MGIGNSKAMQLLSVLTRSPAEFRDRLTMITSSRLSLLGDQRQSYVISDWNSTITRLSAALAHDLEVILRERELAETVSGLDRRMKLLPREAPFGTFHNGDLQLARLCYAVVRALEPETVIETGVCYGVTSLFILAALRQNGNGILHSIDLPPLGREGDRFVGWAIPDDSLKAQWRLHRGVSKKILPPLLQQVGKVGVFVHDSLHTYRNMRDEFGLAWPHILPGGVLISDDIQGNHAFQEFAQRTEVAFSAVVQELEKNSLFGVLVKLKI